MQSENALYAKLVIDRIKNAYSITQDIKLADFLGISPSTLSTWRSRNTLDYKLIFAKCKDLSADHLIHGDHPIFRDPDSPRNPYENQEPTDRPILYGGAAANDLKKKGREFVERIENLPLPVESRKAILESYVRIVDEELRSLQEQKLQDPSGDKP